MPVCLLLHDDDDDISFITDDDSEEIWLLRLLNLGKISGLLKAKYIFEIKYTEAILSNSTRELLWLEITKMVIAFYKAINLLCHLL